MVTCKQFLKELNDYLDPSVDSVTKVHLESHVSECPNCFVIVDTTKRTLEVFKGMEQQTIPPAVRVKLWAALDRKMADKRSQS